MNVNRSTGTQHVYRVRTCTINLNTTEALSAIVSLLLIKYRRFDICIISFLLNEVQYVDEQVWP